MLTGSPNAGRAVAQRAAKVLKKTVLELGSNDAYLVLADADIQKAAKICVQGRTYNAGQTCVAAKRFIIEEAVRLARDEFDTGMVNINGYSLAQPNLPFGGVKQSGYGREHDGFGMHEFVNVKTIMVSQS